MTGRNWRLLSSKSMSALQKDQYLANAKSFAITIAQKFADADAERLFCPVFKKQGCRCIQKYIEAGDKADEFNTRIFDLLQLIKDAKLLSQQKCYNVNEVKPVKKKERNIGLGNGQKKSKRFEEFVLKNRARLRNELNLCERATQKILMYSNNFLHKRLKTTPEHGCRIKRQKGKAVLGCLVPIHQLPAQYCCTSRCVLLALTHARLLQDWRERITTGQTETRRVLAEMLTPCGGTRANCYKFISLVTGCSSSTICKVGEQMRMTGGDREPPQHGLKKWWKDKQQTSTKQPVANQNVKFNKKLLCETNDFRRNEQCDSQVLIDSGDSMSLERHQNEVLDCNLLESVLVSMLQERRLPTNQPQPANLILNIPFVNSSRIVTVNVPLCNQESGNSSLILPQTSAVHSTSRAPALVNITLLSEPVSGSAVEVASVEKMTGVSSKAMTESTSEVLFSAEYHAFVDISSPVELCVSNHESNIDVSMEQSEN